MDYVLGFTSPLKYIPEKSYPLCGKKKGFLGGGGGDNNLTPRLNLKEV